MDAGKTLERYLRHHRTAGSSPKTLEWHQLSIGQFIAQHGGDVEDLRADDLRQYIESLQARSLAQASVVSKVRSLKAWGKWLAGGVTHSPASRFPSLTTSPNRRLPWPKSNGY